MTMLEAFWYLIGIKNVFGRYSEVYIGIRESLRAWLWSQGIDYWRN